MSSRKPPQTPHPKAASVLDAAGVMALLDAHFPQIHEGGRIFSIENLETKLAAVRMAAHARNVRPGNTISGPAMFTLADIAVYTAILGALGPSALQAVTTNLNMTFMRRPEVVDLIGTCRLLKVGRRLVMADVAICPAGRTDLVAHAIATYARPD